jgi:hypothetical protein
MRNPDHLFLGTAGDNSIDMVSKGRMSPYSGFRKITREQVENIRLERELYKPSYRYLGEKYRLTPRTIGAIINRESWK